MNNYLRHFRKELKILESGLEEGNNLAIKDFIPEIEAITEKFSEQGHSGGSAPFYSGALSSTIKNVLSFKPLSPITGDDSEWVEVGDRVGVDVYQNNRLGSVFKEGERGKPYYLDAIVWSGEEKHDNFTGKVEDVMSRQYINLPFNPKTFYIDVVKVAGTECDYTIKDRDQLKEVFEYYIKER